MASEERVKSLVFNTEQPKTWFKGTKREVVLENMKLIFFFQFTIYWRHYIIHAELVSLTVLLQQSNTMSLLVPYNKLRNTTIAHPKLLLLLPSPPFAKDWFWRSFFSVPTVTSKWLSRRRRRSTTEATSSGNRRQSTSPVARLTSNTSLSTSKLVWWSSGPGLTTDFR